MTYQQFFLLHTTSVLLLLMLPIIGLVLDSSIRKINRLSNKQDLWVWLFIFIYYITVFTQSGKVIPDKFIQVPYQKMVCENKTLYKFKD